MPVTIEPLANLVPTSEDYGRMAFVGSDLVAILVSEGQGRSVRRWSVEWIAPVITAAPPTFAGLDAARRWLSSEYRKTVPKRRWI
jgi:hypothetical protein